VASAGAAPSNLRARGLFAFGPIQVPGGFWKRGLRLFCATSKGEASDANIWIFRLPENRLATANANARPR